MAFGSPIMLQLSKCPFVIKDIKEILRSHLKDNKYKYGATAEKIEKFESRMNYEKTKVVAN
jgi:hypothetical protein